MDNAYQCVDVTVIAGDTRIFTLDNRPPPGGQAKTIGFWKNWASCSTSKGKQKPDPRCGASPVPGGIQVDTHRVHVSGGRRPAEQVDGRRSGKGRRRQEDRRDPAFNVAAQYIAFRLNSAAGARTAARRRMLPRPARRSSPRSRSTEGPTRRSARRTSVRLETRPMCSTSTTTTRCSAESTRVRGRPVASCTRSRACSGGAQARSRTTFGG